MRMNIPNKFNPFPVYKQGGSPEPPTPPVLPTITVDTIPQISFDYVDSGTEVASSIAEYVTYTGEQTLDYQLSGTLPSAVSFTSGVFTCIPSTITTTQTANVNIVLSASDVESTAIANVDIETKIQSPYASMPLTFKSNYDDEKIRFRTSGSPYAATFKYSKNGGEWQDYTMGTIIELSSGETVAFSGANEHLSKAKNDYYYFSTSGTNAGIEIYGNIASLVNFASTVADNWEFNRLFYYNWQWSDASNLIIPFTDITENCFRNTFAESKCLTAAPQLPATGLATACYQYFFYHCSGLVKPPSVLPAPTVPTSAYQSMFVTCSSMLSAPVIMGNSNSNYNNAFNSMFQYCTSLKWIEVPFTEWFGTGNWVQYVQTNEGTFRKPTALIEQHGSNFIPSNWTVVNK